MIFIWAAEWRNERSKPSSSSTKPINKLNLFHEINLVFDGVLRCPFAKSIFNFIQHFISFKEKWKSWWNKIDWRLSWRASPLASSLHSTNSRICFHFVQSAITGIISINFMKLIESFHSISLLFSSCSMGNTQQIHQSTMKFVDDWLDLCVAFFSFVVGYEGSALLCAIPLHSIKVKLFFHCGPLAFSLLIEEKRSVD